MSRAVLEDRICELERQVFGQHIPAVVKEEDSFAQALQAANAQFEARVAKREKVQRILARLNEIEKYMDSGFGEESAVSTDCKIRVILAEEQRIRETAAVLERLSELKSILDSEHLNIDRKMLQQFAEIKYRHAEQSERVQKLEEDTHSLLNAYFTSMDLVSKQFAAWNQRLRKAEGK